MFLKSALALVVGGAVAAGVLATVTGQQPLSPSSPGYTYAIPPALDDGWMTGSLSQAGIDRTRLEAMTDSIRAHPEFNIHAVLVERQGRLVYEEYFTGADERWGEPLGVIAFSREIKHDLRSVTKSIVSALVGIASNSGAIRSLDTPVLDYFPEYKALDLPERRQITIHHTLMMGTGLEWNEDVPYTDPKNDEIVMTRSADPMQYVLSRPIVAPPGKSWRYNGGTTQLLGTIVQRATKQPLADYAHARLFSPLGITDVEWLGNLAGVPSAASGLRLRPRDLAKFGSLYVNDGRWNGQQVLPKEWVIESTRRRLTIPGQATRGYAYQWWHACYPTPSGAIEVPTAVGNGTQRVFILQAQQAVVTVLAGRYNDFSENPPEQLLLDFIIPALPPAPRASCPS
ncbi:MAG: serine hydrolase domain-containing protein [Acidobacteriota bacterium]